MKRRALLRATGTVLAAGALSGCLGGDGPGAAISGGDTTAPPPSTGRQHGDGRTSMSDDDRTTPRQSDGPWPEDPEVVSELTIGSRDGVAFPDTHRPVEVLLWNAVDVERTLDVTIGTDGPRDVAFERRVTLPAGAALALELLTPAAYSLSVEGVGSVAVSRGLFDCNDTRVTVAVDRGDLRKRALSTAMGCPGPAVGDVAISSGEGGCGSGDDAAVRVGDGRVVVEGAVETPTPCYEATVDATAYDPERDVLSVTLAADATGGACLDCVGTVPYRATLSLEHDYPGTVVVRHATMQETREVVRAPLDEAARTDGV